MRLYYDMHIHSALSPCADNDMTPNNIVNMAVLKGLDIISVTDHNSCGNLRAVMEAAKDTELLVIPGMEVETEEEVHVLCYFPSIEGAEKMWDYIRGNMRGIKNKSEYFGNQFYMDAQDNIIGEEEELLVSAATLSIYEVAAYAKESGGIAVPAHIDRQSNSVISNLGFMPDDIEFTAVEITGKNRTEMMADYRKYNILTSSDAHNLADISEREYNLSTMHKNTLEIIKNL